MVFWADRESLVNMQQYRHAAAQRQFYALPALPMETRNLLNSEFWDVTSLTIVFFALAKEGRPGEMWT